jgi:NAD(P)-dependent dehydrogenase (short-subunit alcohol dehydrogenase family)
LLQAMRVAAKEGAYDNIRINAVAPGAPDAPDAPWFNDLVRESGGVRAAFDRISRMAAPMARYADGDDVGRLVVMLLSDDSPMTGAALIVDGGYTL